MAWWRDIFKQSVYMSFFTILIPIGAYTIHGGSSAVVALVSYIFLSFFIPFSYVGRQGAGFGKPARCIWPPIFFLVRLAAMAVFVCLVKYGDFWWQAQDFWNWPTVVRDFIFIILMYADLCVMLFTSYGLSRLLKRDTDRGGEQ